MLGPGPVLGEDGQDIDQYLAELAGQVVVSNTSSAFQPITPAVTMVRPRAETPLA